MRGGLPLPAISDAGANWWPTSLSWPTPSHAILIWAQDPRCRPKTLRSHVAARDVLTAKPSGTTGSSRRTAPSLFSNFYAMPSGSICHFQTAMSLLRFARDERPVCVRGHRRLFRAELRSRRSRRPWRRPQPRRSPSLSWKTFPPSTPLSCRDPIVTD